jgi:hypothetical protein
MMATARPIRLNEGVGPVDEVSGDIRTADSLGENVVYIESMLYVYKRSHAPMRPWDVMRHGGRNNIAPEVQQPYLVLWNADVVRKDDLWHYVFEFDVRDSLEISELAQIFTGPSSTPTRFPDDTNWRRWLGDEWAIIDDSRRKEILKGSGTSGGGEVVITTLRVGSSQFPLRDR